MFYIASKASSIALCCSLVAGCAMTLKSPELSSDHPASPSASESATPALPPTLQSNRSPGSPTHNDRVSNDAPAMDHSKHQSDMPMKSDHDGNTAQHDHADRSAGGEPGKAGDVTRDIRIAASDLMRYDPNQVTVKAGETVRFIVTNSGQVPHEFVIGDPVAQREHAEMMRTMPNMKHVDGNTLTLAPGETKTLLWRFSKDGEVEIACHVPGHYEAGMRGNILVGGASPTSQPTAEDEKHDDHKH